MRVAYVRVDLGDPEDKASPVFVLSPVPFLSLYGEDIRPPKSEKKMAHSYSELSSILSQTFKVPKAMLPRARYFRPMRSERQNEERYIYRTVPEGAGEPDWRWKAREALVEALELSRWSFGDGRIDIYGVDCYSVDELQRVLESIAEDVGGKKRIKGEPYQPDYDVLVKEVLANDPYLSYLGLPKTGKRVR